MTYLGIDCGTSALKAVLVDENDRALAEAERGYAPDHPHPLWSEQDPRVWRDAMFAALAALRAEAPAAFAAVRGLSFSGQMHGAVLLGEDDEPTRPAILHNDVRSHAEAAELAEEFPELQRETGVKPMAGFAAPKLMWVRRHEPEVFARTRALLLPKDYLRLQLTGEKRVDMSDAAGAWLLDEARRVWSTAAWKACDAPLSWASPLAEGSEPVAKLRPKVADELGLPRGAVVAAGGGDAAVGAVALGAIRPGAAYISLGTASQLIIASDVYRAAPEKLVHSFAHALPNLWYRMAAMLTGAGALAFAARLTQTQVGDLEREAAEQYRGPGEVVFLPYLSGERTPLDDPYARGVAFGFSPASTRADFSRAVMEGVALTLADARQCLEAAGDLFSQIGLIGGGARSALWTRMIAAAVDREIVRYHGGEKGPAFGAARLARIAATGETPQSVCHPPPIADATAPEPALVEAFARRSASVFTHFIKR